VWASQSIVGAVGSGGMGWAGCVARIGDERGVCRVVVGRPGIMDYSGDRGLKGEDG
jgi:hypothetical protein